MLDIRRAATSDLDVLLALHQEYAAADGHAFHAARALAGFRPLVVDDSLGCVLVAVDDGDPIGYAVVTWGWSIEIGGLDVVLDELYVRERGRGVGGRLLEQVESVCRDRGVKRIFLETERPNEGARRLYGRHGYVVDDSIWMSKELA